jgi:ribosomal protein L2
MKEIAKARRALESDLATGATEQKKRKHEDVEDEELAKSRPPKDLEQAKEIRRRMMRDGQNRLRQHNKEQDLEKEEQKAMKRVEEKATHPLRMEYYEPANLAIFALVTREIQIHELKQTGVRFKFTHIQSLRVQNIVECMSISTHKVSGNLLICLGTQHARRPYRSEIVIFELNQDWEVAQSYRWVWKHS